MHVLHVTKPENGKPTFGYWGIYGIAHPIRLALAASGADFVDVRIDPGDPASDAYKKNWFHAKPGMAESLSFPNLPFYFDDKVSLTQSDAILRHIGRTYDLMGEADKEHILDLAVDEIFDMEVALDPIVYFQDIDAVAKWYEATITQTLVRWKQVIRSKEFLTGSKLSIADLKLYVFLYKLKVIHGQIKSQFSVPELGPEWVAYMKRIEDIPAIKVYMASPIFMLRPLNNPHAKFNN